MKITKYEHACFTVEKDGKLLVVDPGVYTTDLASPENISAIVVTHEHADHFDPAALGALIAHNPDAIIIAPNSITRQLGEPDETLPYKTIEAGQTVTVGPFHLEFFGGTHAIIHTDMATVANVGVMINDTIYYPGDSFANPERHVDTLALPVAAPWMKTQEAIDYLLEIKPRFAFPTHDAILSKAGKGLPDNMMPGFAEKVGTTYRRIDGTSIDI